MTSGSLPPDAVNYHDALAAEWSAGYGSGGFRKRMLFVERALRSVVKPGERWLDLGCGSGVLARRLDLLGAVGMALDGSKNMIRAATSEARSAGLNGFEYRQVETIEHIDLPDASFDGILCSSVIEYLDAPGKALNEMARLLRADGQLLISVPNRFSLVRAAQRTVKVVGGAVTRRNYFPYLDVSRHQYSRRQIVAELEARSFRVLSTDDFDPVLPDWAAGWLPSALIFVSACRL
jgi:2-polyprenyl-6-hydroxyphenyl methylase/3-demethylubiquinone-9 3-methyltransferase